MSSAPESSLAAQPEGRPFLERVRKALAHDLNTPLGTIANYAAILEYHGETRAEEVKAFAGRIRSSTNRTANLLRHLAGAVGLASKPAPWTAIDASVRLRSLLGEVGLQARYPAHGQLCTEEVPFDPDLLSFAWRAFLGCHIAARPSQASNLDLETTVTEAETAIDLWIGSAGDDSQHPTAASFGVPINGGVSHDDCFALELAEELARGYGGSIHLWGKPGTAARLRIALPRPR